MNICLVGFMGSGKTTIGKALSESLKMDWVDLDMFIEQQENRTISDIFKENGETYFRQLEQNSLSALAKEDCVISTGGGVIISKENRQVLQSVCTVYLVYPFETLYTRIAGDETRPLATSYEDLKARYEARLDLYETASQVKINCEGKSINEITQEIITYLKTIA